MIDLRERVEESVDARIIDAIRELSPDEFKDLVVQLLEKMGLKVTAAALSGETVFVEGIGREGSYLVMASRRIDHASLSGVRIVKDKASEEGRLPALVVTSELDKEAADAANAFSMAYADRPRLLSLLRKFGLSTPLLRAVDRQILEREGTRYLPSIGKLDEIMRSAEVDMDHGRLREAVGKLDTALAMKPSHLVAWQKKASALMELGEFERALEANVKASELGPDDPFTWYLMALIKHNLNDLEGEVEAYNMALKHSPRMPAAMLNKGATLFQMGRLEESLSAYDSMLKAYPGSAKALNNRGLVLKALGRTEEALQAFESAAALDPSDVDPLVNKGLLLSDLGRQDEALMVWKESVRIARGRAEVWMGLGFAQKAVGRFEDAAKSFAVAVVLDPNLEVAVRERDEALAAAGMIGRKEMAVGEGDLCREYLASSLLLRASGELSRSLDELVKCVELESSMTEAYLQQAGLLLDMGRLEEALVALKEGVRGDPRSASILLDLEALTYRMGKKEDCLRLIDGVEGTAEGLARRCLLLMELHQADKAVSLCQQNAGRNPILDCVLALSLMVSGKYREGADAFKNALRAFPGWIEGLNGLGVCLRFVGDLQGAEQVLHQAIEAAPSYADAWSNLGCVLFIRGAFDEAEKCFGEAVLIDRHPSFLLNLGMSQLSLDNIDGAQESFASALRIEHSADALNGLGIVAERRKEFVMALELYEAALASAPNFQDALANRDRLLKQLK